MANLLSRTNERRPLRAALLGAAAIAVAGVLTVEALPVASHPALAAASTLSAGPASFADVVDRVKGAVVSVKVKIDQSNVAFDEDLQPMPPMPNFPKGGPLEKFFRQFGERGGQPDISSPTWAWLRAPASSFPLTATSSPTIMSSITPRT